MKLDILFALPGPRNPIQGDKLLVVAAATEHEDPDYLTGVITDVAETAVEAGAYRTIQKVTLELDDSVVVALLQSGVVRAREAATEAKVHRGMLH